MSSSLSLLSHSVPTLVMGEDGDLGKLIPAEFTYEPDDPYAVTITLADDVKWEFDREILHDGLKIRAGSGDVRIQPDAGAVLIELDSAAGSALLDCDRNGLESFLQATYTMVPDGEETTFLDVDACIEQILANA